MKDIFPVTSALHLSGAVEICSLFSRNWFYIVRIVLLRTSTFILLYLYSIIKVL